VSILQHANPAELAQTLGIACSFAGGTWSFIHDGSQTKKLHAGRAAEGGLMAAQLAQAQLSGPRAVFDGDTWGNFFGTYGGPQAVPAFLTDGFGERWRVNRCSLKPYATCRGSHAGIDAISALLSVHRLTAADIAAVHIAISEFQYGMCGSTTVTTRAEAQMSLPYAIAARLVYGKVFLAELEEVAWSAPAIGDWLGRTTVQIDHLMAADAEPNISITTHGGQTYSCTIEHPLGSPERPLSEAQVMTKFRDLVASVIPVAQADAIIAMVGALPQAPSIQPLIDSLAGTV
jgi:2-methylcitrate dehydratase PrpD